MDTAKGADIEATLRALSHRKLKKKGSRVTIVDLDTKQFHNLWTEITPKAAIPVTIYLTKLSFYNTLHASLDDMLAILMDIPVDLLPKHLERFKESRMLIEVVKARLQGLL
jgi:hypothetical protein